MKSLQYAIFPAILTALAAALFIPAYCSVTLWAVEPHWLGGLLFLIPAAVFALVCVLSVKCRSSGMLASLVLMPIMAIFTAICIFMFSIYMSADVATDIERYQKALEDAEQIGLFCAHFPDEIPNSAQDVEMAYTRGFGQAGASFALRIGVTDETAENLAENFGRSAEWSGSPRAPDAERHGVYSGSMELMRDGGELPGDTVVYVLRCETGRAFAAVSRQAGAAFYYSAEEFN